HVRIAQPPTATCGMHESCIPFPNTRACPESRRVDRADDYLSRSGSSASQTVSATRLVPSSFGWIPSCWFRSALPATPSRKKGIISTSSVDDTVLNASLNESEYSEPYVGGGIIPASST